MRFIFRSARSEVFLLPSPFPWRHLPTHSIHLRTKVEETLALPHASDGPHQLPHQPVAQRLLAVSLDSRGRWGW